MVVVSFHVFPICCKMSDVPRMFNNSKKRVLCTDESVGLFMSNLANEFSAQISLASLASQGMSSSSSITLVDDELLTATQNLAHQWHGETIAGLGENPGNFKSLL